MKKPVSKNKSRLFRGFAATFLVMAAMIMMSLGSLGAFSAADGYNDVVMRREYRLEAILDAQSCISVALTAFAHDYFYSAEDQVVPDFSCTIVSAVRNGDALSIQARGTSQGIVETAAALAEDTGRSIQLIR